VRYSIHQADDYQHDYRIQKVHAEVHDSADAEYRNEKDVPVDAVDGLNEGKPYEYQYGYVYDEKNGEFKARCRAYEVRQIGYDDPETAAEYDGHHGHDQIPRIRKQMQ
jgi:hypothetical protein